MQRTYRWSSMSKFNQFARHCQIVNVTMPLMVSSKLWSWCYSLQSVKKQGVHHTLSSLSWCVLRPSTVLRVSWESRPDEVLAARTPRWYDKCQGRYTLRAERKGTTERNGTKLRRLPALPSFKLSKALIINHVSYRAISAAKSPRYYRNVCPYYRGVHTGTAVFPLSP